jgi:lipopolysaccharide/colanic/teichoic acid biosynthesis glycosyltransferase
LADAVTTDVTAGRLPSRGSPGSDLDIGGRRGLEWVMGYPPRRDHADRKAFRLAKRAFDLLVVGATMPLWLTVIVIAALVVALESPGVAPLFVQRRRGRGGALFRMLKLRTMVSDAEERKHSMLHLNELPWPDFKIRRDPRTTRVGRVLRRTSIDELPQLLNVLKGEMSLVGPRPISVPIRPEQYSLYLQPTVAPGVTGLWQILGRGAVGPEQRLGLDLLYCSRACLRLDLAILRRTIPAVILGRGAM